MEEELRDGKLVVYRVGQVDDFKHGLFFADKLDYYDYSDTGYAKEDAIAYELDLNNAKIFDPVKEWNLSVNTWSDMRQSEEFFKEHDYSYYEYLDDVDYDDEKEYHEVITDTDYLSQYAYEEGYDVIILRDIPGDGGRGSEQTEYCVFNKNLIKKLELDESMSNKLFEYYEENNELSFLDACKNRNINFEIQDDKLIFDNYKDVIKCIQLLADMGISFKQNKKEITLKDKTHLQEKIVKKGSKWQVQSEDGSKNLGTYDTKAEAEKRLQQVHYFKHMNEDAMTDDEIRQNASIFWDLGFSYDKYHDEKAQDLVRQYRELQNKKLRELHIPNAQIMRKSEADDYDIDKESYLAETKDLCLIKPYEYSDEEVFEHDFYDHLKDYIVMGMNSGTYFGMNDFTKEEIQYMQKNASKTIRPLYRFENSMRVSKVGDIVDMYPMRSFTATKTGVNYLAKNFTFDDEHINVLYKTQGKTLYYDIRSITQDDEEFAGEDEVFVWGKFKVLDISEINLNKRVFKLVTIEQIDTTLKENYFKHINESDGDEPWNISQRGYYHYYDGSKESALEKISNYVGYSVSEKDIDYLEEIANNEDDDELLGYIYYYRKACESLKHMNEDLQETDSEGNILSKEQVEFFKNSKVRDAQGNLLVCYHGASKPGFKEFKPLNASSQFGKYKFGNTNVNYFTTDKKSAISYTKLGIEENGNVYACYLNVVNPFIVDNKSLASVKSSFNIKDDRIRQKQMSLFDNLWNKYGGMYPTENDLDSINNTLRKLNFEIRPSSERKDNTNYTTEKGYYDLYTLGNNSLYGAERPVMYAYTLDELFDDDMYDEIKETIIGYDEDDYYLSTDDVVRCVLAMNDEDGTNYDGIIIKDIVDSKEMFALAGTDVITLKSSNQIKSIDNKNPTSSNNINESKQDKEKFRQWAGDELASRFFVVKNRLKSPYNDLYYWIKYEKDLFNEMIKYDIWKDNQEKAREFAHKFAAEKLENAIEVLEDTPTRKELDKQAKEGAEKIYEDDRWLVVKINTYGAAVKYGKNTQWCITGTNSQADGGIYDWKFHHESCENDFYFFIDKKKNKKYALEYYDNNNWALYNEEDYVEVGYGSPFNSAMDALGDPWRPDHKNSYPAFPKVKGLPDLQQAYRDAIADWSEDDLDVNDYIAEKLIDDELDEVNESVKMKKDMKKVKSQVKEAYVPTEEDFSYTLKDITDDIMSDVKFAMKREFFESLDLKEDINKYYRIELEDQFGDRSGIFVGAFELIPTKETIENYPEDFDWLTDEERARYYKIDELISKLGALHKSPGVDTKFDKFRQGDIFAFTPETYKKVKDIVKELKPLVAQLGLKIIVNEVDVDDEDISFHDEDQVAFSYSDKKHKFKEIEESSKYDSSENVSLKEAKGKDTFIFKDKKAWSGAVNTLDGAIEEVHSYEEAQDYGFHHSFYFSDEQLDKMEKGETCFFCVFNDGKIMINAMSRFNPEDVGIKLDEKFLEKRIREQIKIITNEDMQLTELMRGKENISDEKILKYIDECIADMKTLSFAPYDYLYITYDDIDVEEGDTARTFGTMYLPQSTNGNFKLVLNKHMFEESEEAIKNTIYHELCHYVVYKMAIENDIFYRKNGHWLIRNNRYDASDYKGHGRKWKQVAQKVSNAFNTEIKRTNNYAFHTGVGAYAEDKYKYIVKCKHCGNTFKYFKKTDFIKSILDGKGHTEDWWCKCKDGTKGHDFEIVKGK